MFSQKFGCFEVTRVFLFSFLSREKKNLVMVVWKVVGEVVVQEEYIYIYIYIYI